MIAVFAGTSEGRRTVSLLLAAGVRTAAFTAEEYGAEILRRECPGAKVFCGRLAAKEMHERLRELSPAAVIDATHPYADEASRNIRAACEDIPYIRVSRPREETPPEAHLFDTMDAIVSALDRTDKTVLATTGAKELAALTNVRGYRERLWIRILPLEENISRARGLGFSPRRIIAAQGPFPRELELALLHFTGAGILVTKASGRAGGFLEKAAAAKEAGAELFVLSPPDDSGVSVEEAVARALSKEESVCGHG